MYSRVIIATDLSSAAFAVVRNLSGLKAYGTEECLLLECLSLPQVGSIALSYTYSVLQKNLQEQGDMLERQGFRAEIRIVPGMAAFEINRIAIEENYSLVVVGAQSRSMVSEVLLGGIAFDIIHRCRLPIFLVRLEENKVEGMSYFQAARRLYNQHVLFPTDFSETAHQAFQVVKDLASTGTRKITLMHVQDQAHIDPHLINSLAEFNEIDESRLTAMKETLQKSGDVDVDIVLAYGNPSSEIIHTIRDREVQLTVMGSQGRGYVSDLFLGSVSHNVARQSDASVLLIPANKEMDRVNFHTH